MTLQELKDRKAEWESWADDLRRKLAKLDGGPYEPFTLSLREQRTELHGTIRALTIEIHALHKEIIRRELGEPCPNLRLVQDADT